MAKKSICLVLRKGHVDRRVRMQIQGEHIPLIVGNPIECLGKWFNESPTNKESIEGIKKKLLSSWLRTVDGSGLLGKYKAWIYQHGILPRLMWLILIYEIATTIVEAIERKVSGHLRRLLGVPPSFTSIGLYSNSMQISLPVSFVVEDFKVAKCRLVTTWRDSAKTELLELGSRQGQEGSGLQKHQWTKQKICYTYETSLETQKPGGKEWKFLL